MSHNYLLEIGLEEMPANVIVDAEKQFKENVETFLTEEELPFTSIETFSTPRRLAVLVNDLAERQPDKSELVKGPSKKVAVDAEGNWTKAAIGFTKGQSLTTEDIIFKETKGEEYVYVEKFTKGKFAEKILEDIIGTATSINFPLSMKWANNTEEYIRPIHWLVSLLDSKIIPLQMFDVEASNVTNGHRFLGEKIVLSSPSEYVSKLEKNYVIPKRDKRRQMITKQIENLCSKNNWADPLYNSELLEEVTDLIEYPTTFYGSFDEKFLEVPESVLETSMADHQRYFPVRKNDETAEFLPYFIGVRNGNSDYLEEVVKGNEKVLVARLEDAKFFYEEDKKSSIEEFVEKLKNVNYHEKLGSLYDKQNRVGQITEILADELAVSKNTKNKLKRASEIYKFDLVTNIVGEFTNLQGTIGTIYAEEKNEDVEVAAAIEQQYMPRSANGEMPYSEVGIILSLAEKMDTIQMFFSVGVIPSGSNDPFALRRTALGIVRIINEQNLSLSFRLLSNKIIDELNIPAEIKNGFKENENEYFEFIKDRINNQLKNYEDEIPFDIRQAVLQAKDQDIVSLFEKAELLNQKKDTSEYKLVKESLNRVANLVKDLEDTQELDKELFETESEKGLYEAVVKINNNFTENIDVNEEYENLVSLSPLIANFFDNNMVNTENEDVRQNRYSLLSEIQQIAENFADFSQIVV